MYKGMPTWFYKRVRLSLFNSTSLKKLTYSNQARGMVISLNFLIFSLKPFMLFITRLLWDLAMPCRGTPVFYKQIRDVNFWGNRDISLTGSTITKEPCFSTSGSNPSTYVLIISSPYKKWGKLAANGMPGKEFWLETSELRLPIRTHCNSKAKHRKARLEGWVPLCSSRRRQAWSCRKWQGLARTCRHLPRITSRPLEKKIFWQCKTN